MKISILKKQEFLPYIFIAFLSFFTICVWYKTGKLLFFADSTYPTGNPFEHLYEFFYGWKSSYSGGVIDTTGYAIMPLFIIIGTLQAIGISPVYAQAIFFFAILVITGSSAIFFLRYLGKKYCIEENHWAIIIPAVFYIFNLYIAINAWRMIIFLYLFYALLPLLIVWFLKFLDTEKAKYAIYCGLLTSTVVSIALTNVSYLFILFFVWFLLLFLDTSIKSPFRLLTLFTKFIFIWIPLNIWYLLPQFFNISGSAAKATGGGNFEGSLSILNVISSHASYLNTLSLTGFYSLYDTVAGEWFSWSWLYTDSIFKALTLFFPIVLVFVILNKKIISKVPRLYFFSIFLVIFGAFLSKGSHPPNESLFIYLLKNYPIPFLAFRAAYEKLGILIVIGYLTTLYLFLNFYITTFKSKLYSGIIIFCSLAIILLLGFPMWTGKVFDSNNNIRANAHITIPDDYYNAAITLKKDPNALTLSLPLQPHTWISSSWDNGKQGYLGGDILRLLSHTPIISTEVGNTVLDDFNRNIEADFFSSGVNTDNLVARHVKYVLVRKDINFAWALAYGKKLKSPLEFIQSIENSNRFTKIFDSHTLALYELINPTPKSYIYVQNTLISFEKSSNFHQIRNFISRSLMINDYNFISENNYFVPSKYIAALFDDPKLSNINISQKLLNATSSLLEDYSAESKISKYLDQSNSSHYLYINSSKQVLSYKIESKMLQFQSAFIPGLAINSQITDLSKKSKLLSQFKIDTNSNYIAVAGSQILPLNRDNNWKIINTTNKKVDIYAVSPINSVPNGSFEDGLWLKSVRDCDAYDKLPILSMTQSKKSTTGLYALELSATRHIACTDTQINGLINEEKYLFSFDYQGDTAEQAGFYLSFTESTSTALDEKLSINNNMWQHYEKVITTTKGVIEPKLYLYAYSTSDEKNNVVRYDNIQIRKISKVGSVDTEIHDKFIAIPIEISTGDTSFSFTDSTTNFSNKMLNGDLSHGLWSKVVGDCNNYDEYSDLAMDVVTDSRDSGKSLALTATRHTACTGPLAVSVTEDKTYLLSFEYQSHQKTEAGFYLAWNGTTTTPINQRLQINNPSWQVFETQVTAPKGATGASLLLYAYEKDGVTPTTVTYDNVSLIELPNIQNRYYVVNDPHTNYVSPKNISFDLINPTKKLVHIKGATTPFYLAMSESFHPSWQAQFNNEKINGFFDSWVPFVNPDRIPDEQHFELNGFLNGWYINTNEYCVRNALCTKNPDGSYDIELTLEFFPQRWFYLGLLISGTTFVGLIGFLIYDSIRRRKLARQMSVEQISY